MRTIHRIFSGALFEKSVLVTVLLIAVFAVGCRSSKVVISPAVKGAVVDGGSGQPIEGAEAVVALGTFFPPPTTLGELTNFREPKVYTKADGSFKIPEGKKDPWASTMDSSFVQSSTLLVRANGFEAAIIPVTNVGQRATNVGTIFLQRMK